MATDGHKLGAVYDKDAILEGADKLLIPMSFIMRAKLQTHAKGSPKAYVWHDNLSSLVSLAPEQKNRVFFDKISKFHSYMEFAQPIDGTFPDWRRVIPKEFKAMEAINYNANYMSVFRSKEKAVRLWSTGPMSPSLIRISQFPEFVGCLMPMNISETALNTPFPDWLKD